MCVHVDRSKCQAHNRCHSVAPDVYELDDMGFAHASMTTVSPLAPLLAPPDFQPFRILASDWIQSRRTGPSRALAEAPDCSVRGLGMAHR